MLRTSIVVDYQNVHLTAHDVFDPHGELRDSLIHPMLFARRAVLERNSRQREGHPLAELSRVLVYRGLHHVDHDWEQNRRCLDQATKWRADGAEVELRDLKYRYQYGADGRPVLDVNGQKVPIGRPEEKGIDVLCALACLREAAKPDVDLIILASRDTDLVPVLDELYDNRGQNLGSAAIETVAWFNPQWREENTRTYGSLVPTAPRRIWNTNLNRSCYEASIDRAQYR